MRILTTLTYYTPHISGLTVYASRIVKGLTERGHQVTILTSRFRPDLPRRQEIDGAQVIRSSVVLRLGKGVLMPSFFWHVARLMRQHDALYLHLPQVEAAAAAAYGRLTKKPVVTMYHCDIELPPGLTRTAFHVPIALSHHLTAMFSDHIVANCMDYAENSAFLSRYQSKLQAVYPPCPVPRSEARDRCGLRCRYGLGNGPIVGFLGRFAEEKGVQYLIDAVPEVLRSHPDARFVLAGERERVFGERVYERLLPKIEALGDRLVFPGQLPAQELAEFFASCDVLVLPSVNSTESFGMVQVEAMHCGTPVVASDLPGVREPVRATGMGELATPGEPHAIAAAIVRVLNDRSRYVKSPSFLQDTFSTERTVDFYERLFEDTIAARSRK